MEEKERYEIHIYDDICVDLYDNGVLDKSINDTYKLEDLLNQQDKRIKELEQEKQQLKQQLAEQEKEIATLEVMLAENKNGLKNFVEKVDFLIKKAYFWAKMTVFRLFLAVLCKNNTKNKYFLSKCFVFS